MWYILISQEKLWHPEYKWCYKCIRSTFERINFVEYCLKAMLSMLSPVHFKIYHAPLPCETLIAFTKIALPVYHCPIWKGWRNNTEKLIISWTTNEDAIYSLKQHPCPIGNFFSITPCQGELYCEQLAWSYFMATVNHITDVTFFFFCCGKAQNQIKAAESNNRTESVLSPSQDSLDHLLVFLLAVSTDAIFLLFWTWMGQGHLRAFPSRVAAERLRATTCRGAEQRRSGVVRLTVLSCLCCFPLQGVEGTFRTFPGSLA